MKLKNIVLAGLLTLGFTFANAELTADFQGLKGNQEAKIDTLLTKIETIGYSTVTVNSHIEKFYFNKFKEKGVEMLSFFAVVNKEKLRPLLLANPDFGAYAPFNFLAYKTLDSKADDNTWFGHLSADTMLNIIGEKDEANKKAFTAMVADYDTLVNKELKPTLSKKFERKQALPEKGLTKLIKKFDTPEDLEDWVDEFVSDHDGRFAKANFVIAGFIDFKFEYDDMELDFDKYDAYWVSLLCHFEFSNSIFNRGKPEAGMFAPCSIYFYIPKGTNELHVGYASVDNWINGLNFTDAKRIESMKKMDADVSKIFKEMGFEAKK
ncbi:hypothetical protein MNB_SV-13-1755 [hydrothermal vent metagenome]|uniref:DUF302 domain-containing protein n=1 Tax=hydrothermal vent metagenome TaxID=652676 RepID=A0A1W1CIH3_9ZZZZ